VTGTEQFRFDRRPAKAALNPARGMASLAPALANAAAAAPADATADSKALSRVTGEGSGQRITGDDWDRGDRVTGTEGVSARRRNPSRSGSGSGAGNSAMPRFQPKRNEELPEPVSKITGSSGSTDRGSLITVSGGARG
ncbi:MAG: carboxysome shell protein, partial [Cyanobacteriota bacterium]